MSARSFAFRVSVLTLHGLAVSWWAFGCASTSARDGSPSTDASSYSDASVPLDASLPDGGNGTVFGSSDAGLGAADACPPSLEASAPFTCTGASPSFSADVVPLLTCGGELCHSGASQWTYATLVNAKATRDTCAAAGLIVAPGDLDASYLMNKLTGDGMCPCTARMPNLAKPMPDTDIQTIADWICSGAKND